MKQKQNIKIKYLVEIVAFTFIFIVTAVPTFASEITPENIIKLTNDERSEQGIASLDMNEKLMEVAKDKLNDMIKNNYFAHTSPAGINPWHWFSKNDYDYLYAGENLAINFLTAEEQEKAWMNSPTHRKNILNNKYNEIGVAVGAGEIDGQLSIIAVQEFGARSLAVNSQKKFSDSNNSNLIKEGEKIVPQVLAMKNYEPQKSNVSNSPEDLKEKLDFLNLLSDLAVIIFIFSVTAFPIAFLSVAYEKLQIILEKRKKEKLQVA